MSSGATPNHVTGASSDSGRLRSDACGAQAYVRVQLSAGELLFCAHHATRHEEKLRQQAVAWHDETSRLHGEKAAAGQPAE